LHALASELGMASLAQQCLIRLSTETDDLISTAVDQGISLGQVLDLTTNTAKNPGQSPLPHNMVQVVFSHVLKDEQSPQRLVALVIARLAEHLDLFLWEKLAHRVNHSISLLIIQAMLHKRQVKIEKSSCHDVR
jgi:hypothetical protein